MIKSPELPKNVVPTAMVAILLTLGRVTAALAAAYEDAMATAVEERARTLLIVSLQANAAKTRTSRALAVRELMQARAKQHILEQQRLSKHI